MNIIDHASQENLPLLYYNATFFVFLSLYEGFGIPPLEAMACGCPVMASTAVALHEICGDAAYSVDEISGGIYKLIKDKELRDSLTEKGLERIKLFSWEKSAKNILSIFNRCKDL